MPISLGITEFTISPRFALPSIIPFLIPLLKGTTLTRKKPAGGGAFPLALYFPFFFQVRQQFTNPLSANSGTGAFNIRKTKGACLITDCLKHHFRFRPLRGCDLPHALFKFFIRGFQYVQGDCFVKSSCFPRASARSERYQLVAVGIVLGFDECSLSVIMVFSLRKRLSKSALNESACHRSRSWTPSVTIVPSYLFLWRSSQVPSPPFYPRQFLLLGRGTGYL